MFDLFNKVGVKSYSFRNIKDNAECAKTVRRCESTYVDLSAAHVNYDAPETWDKSIADFTDNGVTIAGAGVVLAKNDEAWNRRFFEFGKKAGIELLSISFEPTDWEKTVALVEKLSEEYGILTAIHNHGGYNWMGNITALKYVFSHCSKRIGLCQIGRAHV